MTRRLVGALLVATSFVLAAAVPGTAATSRPSKTARMICQAEVRGDLAGVLASKPTTVTRPTWSNGTYSCTYRYPTGSFAVSVTELRSRAATRAFFDERGVALQRTTVPVQLGDDAFQTSDGSTVVRKDDKVLEVDAAQLPARFGKQGLDPASVTSAVATVILGCWTG
jgi:hypothetical protein